MELNLAALNKGRKTDSVVERKPHLTRLVRKLDPELAYLALLTDEGLKPMSRWEKSFGREEVQILQKLGLRPRVIERRVKTGKIVHELIFGRMNPHLDVYQRRFSGSPIDRSPETVKLEGFLFGYPCCCVEEFIRKGYQKNGLHPEDQRILFHWACRGCQVTPLLLPDYHRVWRECQELFSQPLGQTIPLPLWRRLSRRFAVVATTAWLVLAPGLVATGLKSDPHLLHVAEDKDGDGLSDFEESHLNTNPDNPDTDGDGVLDGAQLAQQMHSVIDTLKTYKNETEPYKAEYIMRGVEKCEICGQWVNMGYIVVINPLRELQMEIPYIGLHYMAHGSFAYEGDLHKGRIDPVKLAEILGLNPTSIKPACWAEIKMMHK